MTRRMIRQFFAALAVLLVGTAAANAQGTSIGHLCSQALTVTQSQSGLTALLGPGVSATPTSAAQGKQAAATAILICGYTIQMGTTAGTASLAYGTGTACGTGTVQLTPAWSLAIGGILTDNADYFRGLSAPPGTTLCLDTSQTASILIYYNNLPF